MTGWKFESDHWVWCRDVCEHVLFMDVPSKIENEIEFLLLIWITGHEIVQCVIFNLKFHLLLSTDEKERQSPVLKTRTTELWVKYEALAGRSHSWRSKCILKRVNCRPKATRERTISLLWQSKLLWDGQLGEIACFYVKHVGHQIKSTSAQPPRHQITLEKLWYARSRALEIEMKKTRSDWARKVRDMNIEYVHHVWCLRLGVLASLLVALKLHLESTAKYTSPLVDSPTQLVCIWTNIKDIAG